jgi:transcriptional regulator with XRE-family HTH domain
MSAEAANGQNPQGAKRTLADKIDHLFVTVRPARGGEFRLNEVVDAINQRDGEKLTAAYLSQLRSGQRANPTKGVLEALAWFFGVSPAYFFDDEVAGRIEAELELVMAMRRASVQQIALRAADLSEESLRNLAVLIEHWRELERSASGPGTGRGSGGRES